MSLPSHSWCLHTWVKFKKMISISIIMHKKWNKYTIGFRKRWKDQGSQIFPPSINGGQIVSFVPNGLYKHMSMCTRTLSMKWGGKLRQARVSGFQQSFKIRKKFIWLTKNAYNWEHVYQLNGTRFIYKFGHVRRKSWVFFFPHAQENLTCTS